MDVRVKKAEPQRIDAFELWCWRRLLRVPWTERRSNQSILKEISPGCSFGRTDAEAGTPILWPPDAKGCKRSVFISIPKKGNAKECSNYCTIALISHASKVMLKILQTRLQQYVNRELPVVQAGFRKGRGTRDKIANIRWIMEKAREFQKKHLFLLY